MGGFHGKAKGISKMARNNPFYPKQLFKEEKVDEVYAYCNREEIRKHMLYGMHYHRRDEKYDRMVLLGASFVKKEFGGAV